MNGKENGNCHRVLGLGQVVGRECPCSVLAKK